MKNEISENKEDDNLNLEKETDALLMETFSIMPSCGSFPFAIIRLANKDSGAGNTELARVSGLQILVLKRTDFSLLDLMDYVEHTKEYKRLRSEEKEIFMANYKLKYSGDAGLDSWTEQITNIGIGIATQLARQKGMTLAPVETNPEKMDAIFGFHLQNLHAYQLFKVKRA